MTTPHTLSRGRRTALVAAGCAALGWPALVSAQTAAPAAAPTREAVPAW